MSISVIIPSYNGEDYIAEALDSVFAQTVPATEIIVIDDGSTDNTAAIVHSYGTKIRYFYQANQGISAARNRGIQLASSEYIAFLDHDDVYLPTKFEVSLAQLKPDDDIVQGKWRYLFTSKDFGVYQYPVANVEQYGYYLGSYIFRKSCFDKVGLFDEEIKFSEDVDLLLRIKNLGLSIKQIEQLCLLYRAHDTNTTKTLNFERQNRKDLMKLLYKSIRMQRKAHG